MEISREEIQIQKETVEWEEIGGVRGPPKLQEEEVVLLVSNRSYSWHYVLIF
jgi:hypothetical protein